MTKCLPDIQCDKPEIEIPIYQVGVQNVRVPIILESFSGGEVYYEVVAKVNMTTNLNKDTKGISMSRLHRNLIPYLDKPLKHQTLNNILEDFKSKVNSDTDSFIKFEFELQLNKKSPLSNHSAPQFYECSFEGRLTDKSFRFFEKIKVQYASYCPCSASLCIALDSNGKTGFPHAQRCYAEILIEVDLPKIIWLEELIWLTEGVVKTIPYPILKREDEQEVARIAAENPMFVEDSIRKISYALDNKDGIFDWLIKCTHEESIHPSEAIAINWKGIEGGLSGLMYL
jgi:GTP cyclohydrolase I